MAKTRKKTSSLTNKLSESIDSVVGIISPKAAFQRKQYRFAYDVIDGSRTRKKRSNMGGTGDNQLTSMRQSKLREIGRDLSRNNPLAKGILKTEMLGVVGDGGNIQAKTADDKWNADAEAIWKEEMLLGKVDITGRFNYRQFKKKAYLSYRRDGDFAIGFTDDKLWAIEGEQIGTPYGLLLGKYENAVDVVNGVIYSKKTKELKGYYIGQPDSYGYIQTDGYKKYSSDVIEMIFNPDRFSNSRGEPALTPSIDYIDKLCDYVDAELVAAKVNACFTMFVSKYDEFAPDAYTDGISSDGSDPETGSRLEKVEPGTIIYGEPGEKAQGIGNTRPGNLFDPFVLRMLSFIGRPLCMPLMLVTLDYAGATFMNARIAYQKAQENWISEQEDIIKPLDNRVWRWFIDRQIRLKRLSDRSDKYRNEIICTRWPYVDPLKEAKADEIQLKNKTTNRIKICARQGDDFDEITSGREKEENLLKEKKLVEVTNE